MKTLYKNIILTITFFYICFNSFSQLNANFSADKTEGCEPLAVNFTNLSTPSSGLNYFWDFGNGNTSTAANPVIVFSNPGVFSVKLKISNGVLSDSITKYNYIVVHSNPEANFAVSPSLEGCAPFQASFLDQTVSETSIIYWHWDFGDGTESFLQNPVHTYTFNNSFGISLFVKDANNCQNTYFVDDYIDVYKPIANFYTNDTFSCNGVLSSYFVNQSQNSVSYVWNFDDGQTSTNVNPTHIYTTSGVYSVTLTANDTHLCTSSITKNNYIKVEDIVADFLYQNDTLCLNAPISFTDNSQNAISYIWDFGDGSTSVQKNPIHSYSNTGTYSIKLVVKSPWTCSDSIIKQLYIEKSTADFSTIDSFSCSVPIDVQYINKSINASSYSWHFANGTSSTAFQPSITLTTAGLYFDTLFVESIHGCKSSKISERPYEIAIPQAYFTPNNLVYSNLIKGCVPLTVNFFDHSVYDTDLDYVTNWTWNFGDNNISSLQNPTHTFTSLDTFSVTLNISTNRGCVSSTGVAVKTGSPQNASFTVTLPQTICASENVVFTNTSQNANLINSCFWSFGDEITSTKYNPTHQYIDTGYMNVELSVYHNGCGSTVKIDSLFYVKGPYANPTYIYNCNSTYTPNFFANAKGFSEISWNFGDGSQFSFEENPSHLFENRGLYNIKVHASNSDHTCFYNAERLIKITDIKANYLQRDSLGCPGLDVVFDGSKSQDNGIIVYGQNSGKFLWNFDDGTSFQLSNSSVNHVFQNKGEFFPQLIVQDINGCRDTITHRIKITKPDVNFETANFSGCMPMTVDFSNLTQLDTLISS